MLFTPICTHRYTVGTPRAADTAAVAPADAHFHDVEPFGAGHLSAPFVAYTAAVGANHAAVGFTPVSNKYACDPALFERTQR